MKILAGRREEVLRRKEEYDKQMDAYNEDMARRGIKRRQDEDNIMAPLQDKLESDLSKFNLLDFDIDLRRGYNFGHGDRETDNYIEVNIRCNEFNKSDEKVALSWSYQVGLDKEGNVENETSSWSGLKATTSDQIESLKQTVEALEFLNNIDWEEAIRVTFPDWKTYYEDAPEQPQSFNHAQELALATLEDAMDNPYEVIKVQGWSEDYPAWNWVRIDGMTDKQVKMTIVSDYIISRIQDYVDKNGEGWDGYGYGGIDNYIARLESELTDNTWNVRAKKVNVRPYDPPETIDLRKLIDEATAISEKIGPEQEG